MKKKLRVVLILLMAAIMSVAACIGLGGCGYEGKFFDKKHLEEHLVPDLPKPKNAIKEDSGNTMWVPMTKDEFDIYAREIYDYLKSCNFQRFGTKVQYADSKFGPSYKAIVCSDIEECYAKLVYSESYHLYRYCFAWANEHDSANQQGHIIWMAHYIQLEYYYNAEGGGYFGADVEMCSSIKLPFGFIEEANEVE